GTVAGATYAWTGPNGFSDPSQNPVISPATTAEAGSYSVTITVNGCSSPVATTTVVVNSPVVSAPTPGSNSPVCSGQTLSLTVNTVASAAYAWDGPNSFSSAAQNPTIAGVTIAADG